MSFYHEKEKCAAIKAYILENLSRENLSVFSVAEAFSTSERTLGRMIRKNFLKSSRDFIKQLRMEKALELLIRTDTSVKSIATMVGYKSISSFNHAFINYFKNKPGYYRRTLKLVRFKQ